MTGNWDWQPHRLKKQFGQLTLADATLHFGKQNEMLIRIGIRINKFHRQAIQILKNLKPF